MRNYFPIKNGFLRHILGGMLLCLGIIGLFLPFLQGMLLISIGLPLMGFHPPIASRIKKYSRCFLARIGYHTKPHVVKNNKRQKGD